MKSENFERNRRQAEAVLEWAKRETEKEVQPDKVEVLLGQGKTATFYREASEVLLENEESAFYLDREETYRLLSLLEAEFKGVVK